MALAAQAEVDSITVDKPIRSAQEPLWDGWATNYNVPVPPEPLPPACSAPYPSAKS